MAAPARSGDRRPTALEARPDGVLHLNLKVVPGASKAGLAGPYGDRLKVRVSAAAESGKASKALLALLAGVLEVPVQGLELLRGHGMPLKTVSLQGVTLATAAAKLGLENA